MQHGLRKHAKYSASSAHRWMTCPGSVKLAEAASEQPEDVYRQDGTRAHELLDGCLKNQCWDASFGMAAYGVSAPGFTSAEQMQEGIESVQVVLDHVYGLLSAYEDAVLYVEQKFQVPSIRPDDTWGTNDIIVVVPSLSMMFVIDFKHGAGEAVDVAYNTLGGIKPNRQLMYYGTGAFYTLPYQIETVVLTVIQPRIIHRDGWVRSFVTTATACAGFVEEVNAAILQCEAENAPLVPDPKGKQQCRWCPAKLTCPAREALAVQAVGSTFRTFKDVARAGIPDVSTLPIERIAELLSVEALFDDLFKEARKIAYNHLRSGGFVPNQKLVETQARREWWDKDGDETNIARGLMNLMGLDPNDPQAWDKVYPRQLITITEAEKLVKEAFREQAPKGKKKQAAEDAVKALAAYTLKQSSGNLTMVELSDPRPAITPAAQNFAQIALPPPPPQGLQQ